MRKNKYGHAGIGRNGDFYTAYITRKGHTYRLGQYAELKDAIAARKKAEQKLKPN